MSRLHHFSTTEPIFLKKQEAGTSCFNLEFNYIIQFYIFLITKLLKLLKKKNTFTDFIDCSKFLISEKYTSAEHLYAEGGSAGGLLMGAIVNMAPELYNGVIAQVPFVDVITTMLDDTIPLTTGEYDEWGNPNDKKYYDSIKHEKENFVLWKLSL